MWKPKEIIIHRDVRKDPVTKRITDLCPDVITKTVDSGASKAIVDKAGLLGCGLSMLNEVLVGKHVLYIAPASAGVVDTFSMPDSRMMCPHFDRLKLASNGCPYQCDWCYLKLTYRSNQPYITVRAQHDDIKRHLRKRLEATDEPVIFNSGEMADSLALEHLTGAAREFIPWFAESGNGYLFMLTKSDNVEGILDLDHQGHTVIAWSMNNAKVSKRFEVGAPTFKRRLRAARKVQKAGYPLRIRIDPIVPVPGWKKAYRTTVEEIFEAVSPERVTLGTLRFEEGFYRMRNSIFATGAELRDMVEGMEPMFPPAKVPGKSRPLKGKYSFPTSKRVKIFRHVIDEIRRHSDCTIALCKESADVWEATRLDLSRCSCVCQLDYADMA